jgi:hypothetical protein
MSSNNSDYESEYKEPRFLIIQYKVTGYDHGGYCSGEEADKSCKVSFNTREVKEISDTDSDYEEDDTDSDYEEDDNDSEVYSDIGSEDNTECKWCHRKLGKKNVCKCESLIKNIKQHNYVHEGCTSRNGSGYCSGFFQKYKAKAVKVSTDANSCFSDSDSGYDSD